MPSIDGAVRGVSGARGGQSGHQCTAAWVSAPSSYFESIRAAAQAGADLEAVFAAARKKIRQAVLRAVDVADAESVTVDWHYDVAAGSAGAGSPSPAAGSPRGGVFAAVAAVALSAGMVICLGWILFRLRRRRSPRRPDSQAEAAPDDAGAARGAGAMGVLQLVAAEDLLKFLETEHPQTIAVVLSQLSPEKAAAILSGLAPDRQVDVSRRIANLEKIDPQTAQEVGQELESRLQDFIAGRESALGGETKLAELLQWAGAATERNVLRSLADTEPVLAESLRSRMFAFDDIASMPSARLRGALEAADGAELALALRIAGKATVRKVFSCLSGGACKRLRGQIERIGPVRLSDVEAAQERLVAALRRMDDLHYLPADQVPDSEVLA